MPVSLVRTRQSTVIEAMRFPLIVMVVIIHSAITFPSSVIEWSLDGQNVFHFTVELISGNLCGIATRCFFLFSGFLFFRYLKEGEFSLSWVFSKWKKRFWSLMVPYLIWNLLMVLAVLIKNIAFDALSITSSSDEMDLIRQGPVYWLLTGPADFPFWYIRDLIIMSLLAPFLYVVICRVRWVSLVLLTCLYFIPVELVIPRMHAVVFFSFGSWLGIHRIDLLPLCNKLAVPAAIAFVILLPASSLTAGRPLHPFLFKCFIPFGIITFINLFDFLTKKSNVAQRLCALSSYAFFIYALHEIYIMGWTKGLCLRLFGDSLSARWISYLLVPVIVTGACMFIFWLLKQFMPNVLSFSCGGRIKSITR